MGRLIDADAFRNKLVEMTNDPFASTNRPLNWSHAYEIVMVELDRMPNARGMNMDHIKTADFTIDDLKRALVEVQRICHDNSCCAECDFMDECGAICNRPPCAWYLEEDTHETY